MLSRVYSLACIAATVLVIGAPTWCQGDCDIGCYELRCVNVANNSYDYLLKDPCPKMYKSFSGANTLVANGAKNTNYLVIDNSHLCWASYSYNGEDGCGCEIWATGDWSTLPWGCNASCDES